MANEVLLQRVESGDQGTFGVLRAGDYICHSIELPWRENRRRISHIPKGRYPCNLILSPRFGYSYWVQQVPGRSEILIHTGAWAGDTEKGFRTHSAGCILLGEKRGIAQDQKCVLISRPAVNRLREVFDGKPFTLTIEETYHAHDSARNGIQ